MAEPRLSKVTITLFWLSLLGVWLVLLVTKRWGLGLVPESIVYVQAAKNLVSGQGLSVFSGAGTVLPLTQFPPLFPFVLSWGWFLGMDAFTWARFLNAALFGVNIFLVGMLAFTYSRKMSSAVFAAILLLASVYVFKTHAKLLSEPLFLAEMLGFFLAFALFLKNKTRESFYLAASFAAASGLTHIVGILLILSGGAAFLTLSSGDKEEKSRRALFFSLLALFPTLLWFVWKQSCDVPASVSAYRLHWLSWGYVYGQIDTISAWLLPEWVPEGLRLTVLGLVIGIIFVLVRRHRPAERQPSAQAALAMVWFLGFFLLAIAVKGFLGVGSGVVGHRFLVFVYAALSVLLAMNWQGLWRSEGLPLIVRQAMLACLIFFVGLAISQSVQFGVAFYKYGSGYASKAWAESQVAKNIRALDDVPVYTNDLAAFYYLTGRPAMVLPGCCQQLGDLPAGEKIADDFNRLRAVAVVFLPACDRGTALAQAIPAVQLDKFMGDHVADIYGMRRKR